MISPVPKPSKKYPKERFLKPKKKVVMESCPLEESEQLVVVEWLRWHNVLFHHSPNGGFRHITTAMKLKRQGTLPGFPDLIIMDHPDVENGFVYVGAAIEMKRRIGATVSEEQRKWMKALEERGWKTCIAHGADEALAFLERCGYGVEK